MDFKKRINKIEIAERTIYTLATIVFDLNRYSYLMRFLTIVFTLLTFSTFSQQSLNVQLLDHWDGEWVDTNNTGVKYNEVWGFVNKGQEYAVIGSVNGAHIFSISNEGKLTEVDFVPGNFQGHVVHRDYHDLDGYLYAVSDQGPSTLQIIDLSFLPDSAHIVYDSDSLINTAHNIFIDPSSKLLYACGPAGDPGMSVFSIANPIEPVLLYDYLFFYVHDVYVRNDSAYLNCGNDGFWVYDFSTPSAPINLGSLTSYPDQGYNHSGWLSEDGKTYILADETRGKKLKVLDVSDLSDINIHSLFGTEWWDETLPHNLMFFDGIAYVSYYNDGLQIFDIRDVNNPKQIGYFDSYLENNDKIFQGVWGVYAQLPSGKLLFSDRSTGLYIVGFTIPPDINNGGHGIYPNPANDQAWFYQAHSTNNPYSLQLFSSEGKLIDEIVGQTDHLQLDLSKYNAGVYLYRYINETTNVINVGKFLRLK